jgi:hypothetical protein
MEQTEGKVRVYVCVCVRVCVCLCVLQGRAEEGSMGWGRPRNGAPGWEQDPRMAGEGGGLKGRVRGESRRKSRWQGRGCGGDWGVGPGGRVGVKCSGAELGIASRGGNGGRGRERGEELDLEIRDLGGLRDKEV